MKEYKSQAFKTRIEINLANISSSPEDEFQLHTAYYDVNLFDCELCGHKNCVYAFEVKNLKTQKILKVGSECIHHFEGKGVDLDLAEALMKRVMKATQKARYELQKEMGEDYKALSKEEKRQKITEQYVINQAKEMLTGVAKNKTILSEDEVNHILDLGLEREYNDALRSKEESIKFQEARKVVDKVRDYISELKKDFSPVDYTKVEDLKKEYLEWKSPANIIDVYVKEYEKLLQVRDKYEWLINYSGSNHVVKDIRDKILRNGSITEKQERYAHSLITKESKSNKNKLNEVFEYLESQGQMNSFLDSLYRQYKGKGFLSEKQEKALMKSYMKIKSH